MSRLIIALAVVLTVVTITDVRPYPEGAQAHQTRPCPSAMGEPCPAHYGHDFCNSLVYDLGTAADVYDVDFVLHSAGCDQRADGTWSPIRHNACERRAYYLVFRRGYSILRTRQMLLHRGCIQFEDGTYGTN